RDVGFAQGTQEAQQRRLRRALVIERQLEELREHIIDLAAEPRMEALQPTLGVEHVRKEIEGSLEIEPAAPAVQLLIGRLRRWNRRGGQRRPQPFRAWL